MKKPHLFDMSNDIHVSGKVGSLEVQVNDFNEIKCPFCGSNLVLHELNVCDEHVEHSLVVNCWDSWTDGIGQRHCKAFGRSQNDKHEKVHLKCPNNCIEDMVVPVKYTTYGRYRELTEIE